MKKSSRSLKTVKFPFMQPEKNRVVINRSVFLFTQKRKGIYGTMFLDKISNMWYNNHEKGKEDIIQGDFYDERCK